METVSRELEQRVIELEAAVSTLSLEKESLLERLSETESLLQKMTNSALATQPLDAQSLVNATLAETLQKLHSKSHENL